MSQDVNRLKELLFENESRALSDLNRRMDIVFERAGSTERFTASVASVLDEALSQAEIERHSEVASAIAPLIVQTIKTEIRGSQDELAEALYPSLGRMVKAYVVSAIRDLMDEINRRLESNRFMLRLRSLLTGRPVAELAFVEGQKLEVEELYLIRRGLGELLGHWPAINGPTAHDQRVSGILTAINEVATEAFDADKAALRRIDLGTSLIYLQGLADASLGRQVPRRRARERRADHRRAVPGDDRAAARAVQRRNRPQCAEPSRQQPARRSRSEPRGRHRRAARQARAPPHGSVAGGGRRLGDRPGVGGMGAAGAPTAGYQTAQVRAIAADVSRRRARRSPAIRCTPWWQHRGRDVALAGLVPTTEAGPDALRRLREALPASQIVDRTTALPSGLDQARADIAALQTDLARARSESAKAEAALNDRVAGLSSALKETDASLHGELKSLAAQLAKANADTQAGLGGLRTAIAETASQAEAARRADLSTVRSEIARAVAPIPARAARDVDRAPTPSSSPRTPTTAMPQAAGAALDELAQLIKDTDVLVRVVGYTDEKGGEERNTPLSQARAQKVHGRLASRGIPASRLVAVGRNDSADLSSVRGRREPQPPRGVRDRLSSAKARHDGTQDHAAGRDRRRQIVDRPPARVRPLRIRLQAHARRRRLQLRDRGGPRPRGGRGAKFIIWDTDGNFGDNILSHIYIKHAAGALDRRRRHPAHHARTRCCIWGAAS